MGCSKSRSIEPLSQNKTSSGSSNSSQHPHANNANRWRPLQNPKTGADNVNRENYKSPSSYSPALTPSVRTSFETRPLDQSYNIINILLLGESGVGKSTFINAIVNYFRFDTLHKARSGKPIALMPVSFLLTVGDQFDEHIVTFGDKDTNEDHHHHPGQSVTQHCKSYVFSIGTQTKVRFIDTPGMGDTRGLDQDDHNMQHILSFINNLSHLNAICILLKPNESRLNVVFRSYFTRLLGFLGENIRHNIIFCFTNTRSTFFAPGNTGPLLKKMLESHSIKNIPFKKENTFCFDSEAFRYLIALENGISFDDYQSDEYRESWIFSATESNRLFTYICGVLRTYAQSQWKSIEHAQFQINQSIRPILEAIRNILRNIILQTEKSSKRSIILVPKMISRPSTICHACEQPTRRYGDFWILLNDLHRFSKTCVNCNCSRNRHIDIDYKLDYEISDDIHRESVDEMQVNLDELKQAIVEFGYFSHCNNDTSNANDPIWFYLKLMIDEENYICQQKGVQGLNSILYTMLMQFKDEYKQNQSITASKMNPIDSVKIYRLIESVKKNDLIVEQLNVIKQYQQKCMNEFEKEIF